MTAQKPLSRPLSEADLEHVLEHGRAAFEALRHSRIFLTGGTGFFGKWLLQTFVYANRRLSLGASLTVLSRNPERFLQEMPQLKGDSAVQFVSGDIRSFDFPDTDFTHILHAATAASVKLNAQAPQEMLDTIVEGTRRVLALADRQRQAPRLLLTSSGAVYGRQRPEIPALREEDSETWIPEEPPSAYADGKRLAEKLCLQAREQGFCQPVIARAFAFVGPYLPLDEHFAIGNFIRDARSGGPIRIQGDGTPLRSYLYGADLAAWLWTLLAQAEAGRVYNVGSDQAVSILELARAVGNLYRCPVIVAQEPQPGQPPARYVPSISRARGDLDLRVWIDLSESLRRTIAFLGDDYFGGERA
jgi:nucleoside-diphosphate-sugar epimerase